MASLYIEILDKSSQTIKFESNILCVNCTWPKVFHGQNFIRFWKYHYVTSLHVFLWYRHLIQKLSISCLFLSSRLGLWSVMLTFSLPKESWCLVDLRCLVSGRSGLQFVAIQAFTKLLFSFSDVLKATNCTFQEVDNIFFIYKPF